MPSSFANNDSRDTWETRLALRSITTGKTLIAQARRALPKASGVVAFFASSRRSASSSGFSARYSRILEALPTRAFRTSTKPTGSAPSFTAWPNNGNSTAVRARSIAFRAAAPDSPLLSSRSFGCGYCTGSVKFPWGTAVGATGSRPSSAACRFFFATLATSARASASPSHAASTPCNAFRRATTPAINRSRSPLLISASGNSRRSAVIPSSSENSFLAGPGNETVASTPLEPKQFAPKPPAPEPSVPTGTKTADSAAPSNNVAPSGLEGRDSSSPGFGNADMSSPPSHSSRYLPTKRLYLFWLDLTMFKTF